MDPFDSKSICIGATVASYIAIKGMNKKSLSPTGAAAAWMVGFLSICCGLRGFVLLMFYQFGTMATKYHEDIKIKIDGDAGKSSVRGPSQVLACSAIAIVCSLFHAYFFGAERAINFDTAKYESTLTCAIIAHHATCLADTLASELGILSKSKPFLLTMPWRKVPPGTNGGVTISGFFWSIMGGLLMGGGTLIMDYLSGIETRPLKMMLFSGTSGLIGSVFDSLLGATVQATYYDADKKLIYCRKEDAPPMATCISGWNLLSNAQVNLLSVLGTCIVGGTILGPFVF